MMKLPHLAAANNRCRATRPHLAAIAACCLFALSGTAESVQAAAPIGYFDVLDPTGSAAGWTLDPDHPEQSIEVEFYIDNPASALQPAARGDAEGPRPDVNAAKHISGNHGFAAPVPAAFRDGQPHRLFVYGVAVDGAKAQLVGSPKSFTLAPPAELPGKGDATITRNGITVSTAARFAGAVSSLRWRDMEFVDVQDHGREIQTAWQGNDAGECYNPTEAGSEHDGNKLSTTSQILSVTASETSIEVVSHPAFWLRPGEKSPYCRFTGQPWQDGEAVNRRTISAATLKKTVTLGYQGLPNVVVYESEITFAASDLAEFPLQYLMLENPAAYLRHRFNHVRRYDLGSGELTGPRPSSIHFSEYAPTAVVAGTADGKYAVGLYSPDIPRAGFVGAEQQKYTGYGFTDWGPVVSIEARLPVRPPAGKDFTTGTYKFRTFLAIGAVEEVAATLRQLAAKVPAAGAAR